MSQPITRGSPALIALLDALGLHGVMVKKIVLTAEAESVVTLEVTSIIQEEDVRDLTEVVKRYEWVERVEPTTLNADGSLPPSADPESVSRHVEMCNQAESYFDSSRRPKPR